MDLPPLRSQSGSGAVITYGGAGLSSGAPGFSPVERAVIASLGDRPNVCLVPTASGDDEHQLDAFRATCAEAGVEGHVLSLFHRTEAPYADVLEPAGLVYVTGGAVANLAALWRLHGLAAEVVSAWRRGTVLMGSSAGALLWSLGGVTTSFGPPAGWTDGLGVVPWSVCPHADTQPDRAGLYRELVASGELPPGYAVDECAAAVFLDGELAGVVSDDGTSGVEKVGG